jgi:hypothetical protein
MRLDPAAARPQIPGRIGSEEERSWRILFLRLPLASLA